MNRSPLALARRIAPAAVLLATMAGCAAAPLQNIPSWPPPPGKARVKFVRSFQMEGDIDRGLLHRIWRVLVPVDPGTIIHQPLALAFSPDEQRLYVGTGVKGAIIRVTLQTGEFERVAADGPNVAAEPIGIALDASENLYVGDATSRRVLVHDRSGAYQREIGRGVIDELRAVALDRKAQLLYVLCGVTTKSKTHRVEVFSLKGEHLRTIGKRGAGPGEFNFPTGITVAPDGRLFVADMLNFRVQVLDPEGTPLTAFGQLGTGAPGAFDKVRGVAFDAFGNVYVTDAQQGIVHVFNSRFQPLMAFGGRFNAPGFLQIPGAIVVDSRNHIFVADSATGKINEYELINTTAEDSLPPGSAAPVSPPSTPPSAPSVNTPPGG